MENAIVLDSITKIYLGKKKAVNALSLTIPKGEFFCFVGPSGCGKSTVLKLIADIEPKTNGTIEKNGKIAMVFQSGALLPWLTVAQNVSFGLTMQGKNRSIEEYLHLVDLYPLRNRYPRDLSGGQRQRVGLARALAIEPDILLLDEPFSALDLHTTEELHTYLLEIWQQTKKTIIMVSHSLEEAVLLSDRVGIMRDGELIKVVPITLSRPRSPKETHYTNVLNNIQKEFV